MHTHVHTHTPTLSLSVCFIYFFGCCFSEPVKQNNSRYVWLIADFVSSMCLSYSVKSQKLSVNTSRRQWKPHETHWPQLSNICNTLCGRETDWPVLHTHGDTEHQGSSACGSPADTASVLLRPFPPHPSSAGGTTLSAGPCTHRLATAEWNKWGWKADLIWAGGWKRRRRLQQSSPFASSLVFHPESACTLWGVLVCCGGLFKQKPKKKLLFFLFSSWGEVGVGWWGAQDDGENYS